MNFRISVVIPSARNDRVINTIKALQQQTLAVGTYEIIIVTPVALNIAIEKDIPVKIVQVDKLYPPGNMRNYGAQVGHGDFFCFIDDDCLPAKDWLESLLNIIESHKDLGMVGCRVIAGNNGFWARCADYCLFTAYQYQRSFTVELGSAAIIVRKNAFHDVNGFDEQLQASEDWDFSLRLQNKGWKCFFSPDTEVQHYHGRESFFAILNSAYLSGIRSGLIVQEKHKNQLTWLAKLSVLLRSPFLYWILILPYAAAVTMFQVVEFVKTNRIVIVYSPIMFLSRIAYHCGVLRRLFSD